MLHTIPFLDLTTHHRTLARELAAAFDEVLRSGRFVGGPAVEDFENRFARLCNSSYCVGTGSGTDGLRFALMAAGVGRGDCVVTVPNTFVATAEAITQAGALPVFVDIDPRTYTLSPDSLGEFFRTQCEPARAEKVIHRPTGRRVAAIVPVHLYGQTANMDPIMEIANRTGCAVVEDACQAHGSQYYSRVNQRWMRAGEIGTAAAFSFYPGKNLGAFGEGGAVTTSDKHIAETVRMLRDHGQRDKYHHLIEGYNGRLDTIQAAVLGIKLPYLEERNERRRQLAQGYSQLLGEIPWIVPPVAPAWARPVYHLYVIQSSDRDRLRRFLLEGGIHTGLHYPIPLHLQPAYSWLGYHAGDLPVSEQAAQRILSLPMYPELGGADQERIVATILDFAEQAASGSGDTRVMITPRKA